MLRNEFQAGFTATPLSCAFRSGCFCRVSGGARAGRPSGARVTNRVRSGGVRVAAHQRRPNRGPGRTQRGRSVSAYAPDAPGSAGRFATTEHTQRPCVAVAARRGSCRAGTGRAIRRGRLGRLRRHTRWAHCARCSWDLGQSWRSVTKTEPACASQRGPDSCRISALVVPEQLLGIR